MDKKIDKDRDDICFICSYGWQRITECRECLFNVLKDNGKDWWTERSTDTAEWD